MKSLSKLAHTRTSSINTITITVFVSNELIFSQIPTHVNHSFYRNSNSIKLGAESISFNTWKFQKLLSRVYRTRSWERSGNHFRIISDVSMNFVRFVHFLTLLMLFAANKTPIILLEIIQILIMTSMCFRYPCDVLIFGTWFHSGTTWAITSVKIISHFNNKYSFLLNCTHFPYILLVYVLSWLLNLTKISLNSFLFTHVLKRACVSNPVHSLTAHLLDLLGSPSMNNLKSSCFVPLYRCLR